MRRTALLLLAACAAAPDPYDLSGEEGVSARFDVGGAFWEAPFPSDHRVDADTRRVDVETFPNPDAVPFVGTLVGMLDDQVQGWGVSGALYLPFEGPLSDAALPDLAGSVEEDALAYVIDVDPASPEVGRRFPVDLVARSTDSPWGPRHALVALPLPGLHLPERRRLAFVAHRLLLDAEGEVLGQAPALLSLAAGEAPEGWRADVAEQYLDAVGVLEEQGVELRTIAGLSVFTTGRADRDGAALLQAARDDGGIRLKRSPRVVEDELHEDYCVFETLVDVPVFQGGTPPYATEGGGFVFDLESGAPVVQERQQARVFFSIPRTPPLETERPTVVFVRTGGGGDRPLLDRGPRDGSGEAAPLSGYAGTFARAGWAGVQIDGPLGGPFRNPDGADEQFLLFNVTNPVAMRDNLRQTALELALVPDLLERVLIPPGSCPGLSTHPSARIEFDAERLVLFGHSMGATVGPLAAALEPRYRALVLSGAGGSWIENIVHKELPLPTRPIAATMLGEAEDAVDRYHPVLTLLQWAGESADPPLVAPGLLRDAADADTMRHVLMFQGVEDHYIPPPVANALSVGFGLDLGGNALDVDVAEPGRDALSLLARVGGAQRTLPGGLNRGDADRSVTGMLVQLAEDGIEDGHEVVFQRPEARHFVRCFLDGMETDQPLVDAPGVEADPCPPPPGPGLAP